MHIPNQKSIHIPKVLRVPLNRHKIIYENVGLFAVCLSLCEIRGKVIHFLETIPSISNNSSFVLPPASTRQQLPIMQLSWSRDVFIQQTLSFVMNSIHFCCCSFCPYRLIDVSNVMAIFLNH